MTEDEVLAISPTVSWRRVSADKFQVQIPGRDSLTFTTYTQEIESLTNFLVGSPDGSELAEWVRTNNISDELISNILDVFTESGVLQQPDSIFSTEGIFSNLLNVHTEVQTDVDSLPAAFFGDIIVEGTGSTYEVVSRFLTDEDSMGKVGGETAPPLTIFCCDTEDIPALRERNAHSVREESLTLYVRWTGEHLKLGPLYIPNQTACFECYLVRSRASTEHRSEFDASVRHRWSRAVDPTADIIYERAVQYLVGRYLEVARRGAFSLTSPNEIESWNIVTAEKTVGVLVRVPRCSECGRLNDRSALKAFRELTTSS